MDGTIPNPDVEDAAVDVSELGGVASGGETRPATDEERAAYLEGSEPDFVDEDAQPASEGEFPTTPEEAFASTDDVEPADVEGSESELDAVDAVTLDPTEGSESTEPYAPGEHHTLRLHKSDDEQVRDVGGNPVHPASLTADIPGTQHVGSRGARGDDQFPADLPQ